MESFPSHSPVTFARHYILEAGSKSCSRKHMDENQPQGLERAEGKKGLSIPYATIIQEDLQLLLAPLTYWAGHHQAGCDSQQSLGSLSAGHPGSFSYMVGL